MPVTVSVLPLWNHTALVPVSGWVRTRGCTVGDRRLELGLHDIRIAGLHPRAADQRILGFASAIFSFTSSGSAS